MTHVLILSGTQKGGVAPNEIFLTTVLNADNTFIGGIRLDYVHSREIDLTRVTNAQTFGSLVLQHVVVHNINLTRVTNTNTIGALQLAAVAFAPANAETSALIAAFDQVYTTTVKRQIDTLISDLKTAGVWAKLDWYGNAYWALSEHDALLNWVNTAQTLMKVGSASWSIGAGLVGVNPAISNSRYKSGWNLGSGPHSSAADFAFFCKITTVDVPQNGMLPMGVWRLISGGGPVAPDGAFLSLSIIANSGFAGASLASGQGNTSFAPGDGLGVWGVSHNGASAITVKDGATLETDSVSLTSSYTDPDGMSVAGSAGSAKKSFPGTQLYWGWGAALTAVQFGALETSFQASLLPPFVGPSGAYLIVDGGTGDYFVIADDGTGDYLLTES